MSIFRLLLILVGYEVLDPVHSFIILCMGSWNLLKPSYGFQYFLVQFGLQP